MPPQTEAARRADAIRCPRDYPPPGVYNGVRTRDRDVARNLLFGPLLGCARVQSRELVDSGESFVAALDDPHSPHPCRYYPGGHPLEKQDRYQWYIAVR